MTTLSSCSTCSIAKKISCSAKQAKLPCTLVLLHGWGVDARVWQPMEAWLTQWADVWTIDLHYCDVPVEKICDDILGLLPEKTLLIGWSLGGMLATKIAAKCEANTKAQQKNKTILGLITLAANAKFVADKHWPAAMPQATFDYFVSGLKKDASRQLKRFFALVSKGDIDAKQQLQQLSSFAGNDSQHLVDGLHWLNVLDNSSLIEQMQLNALFVFGENDALVPKDAASFFQERISRNNSGRQVLVVLNDAGHCLHFPRKDCRQYIEHFFQSIMTKSGIVDDR